MSQCTGYPEGADDGVSEQREKRVTPSWSDIVEQAQRWRVVALNLKDAPLLRGDFLHVPGLMFLQEKGVRRATTQTCVT